MKILLLGEYSNVHWTLAEGLRTLGHQVTVVSDGDGWKNYPRDKDISRNLERWGKLQYAKKLLTILPKLRGYDVVQLINPMFLELRAERIFPIYRWLRRNNGIMVLGAFGMDYYWVHENITRLPLRYSDFNLGSTVRTDPVAMFYRNDWIGTVKGKLSQTIAEDCDAIVAGLYEYWATYAPIFPQKTTFIPFPIHCKQITIPLPKREDNAPLRLFIGINKERTVYKGTDIMLRAAQQVVKEMPQHIQLTVAESIPFQQYTAMMESSEAIMDQLYSYTPSMNPLEAMSRGLICIGGGEPENYEILKEDKLRPIINVQPTLESCVDAVKQLALHPEMINTLRQQSIEYVQKHHNHIHIAEQYDKLYHSIVK